MKALRKIIVIGSPGSGKSYLAKAIGKKLCIEVDHLDDYFWDAGWVEKDENDWRAIQNRLLEKKEFIIDGNYLKTLENRIERADLIVFMNKSTGACIFGVLKRTLKTALNIEVDLPEKIKAQQNRKILEDGIFNFIKYVFKFHKYDLPEVEKLIFKYKNEKSIVRVKNKEQIRVLLENLY